MTAAARVFGRQGPEVRIFSLRPITNTAGCGPRPQPDRRPESAHNAHSRPQKALNRILSDPAGHWMLHLNFWHSVAISGEDECWLWRGAMSANGYGSFRTGRRVSDGAHRVAYALFNRTHPDGLHVCHKCDNPRCVNPRHLFLGTRSDNMQDKVRKGRARSGNQKGENNPRSKLTADQAEQVKQLITSGRTNTEIAKQFGVSHTLISAIRRGKAWGNVPLQPKYESLRQEAPHA